jgi:nucleoside-diphosphate-sugar epimerase
MGIVPAMPVIVVGADTVYGLAAAGALSRRHGEVRAFVTDPDSAPALRELGIKVAIGDVSDGSHIEGAALQAFCAVLIAAAGTDDRERSFASTFEDLVAAWIEAVVRAGVQRVIWIGPDDDPPMALVESGLELAALDTRSSTPEEIAAETFRLDDLASLE